MRAVQVLIDADNVSAPRLRAFLRALPADEADVVVAGSPAAVAAVTWPAGAVVHTVAGWQRADVALVEAYAQDAPALVIVSGDGDFTALAAGHRGPVLVVSDRPASGLRRAATVLDPIHDGLDRLRTWFDAVTL